MVVTNFEVNLIGASGDIGFLTRCHEFSALSDFYGH